LLEFDLPTGDRISSPVALLRLLSMVAASVPDEVASVVRSWLAELDVACGFGFCGLDAYVF
jgi:hypothetical protein